jgi:hypothetical protein
MPPEDAPQEQLTLRARIVDAAGMSERGVNSRNEALEFARRARQNLRFIEEAAAHYPDADVYVVTQLTLSLLGAIVFPKEKLLLDQIERTPLTSLTTKGWPEWKITRDDLAKPTSTLGDLLRHVRNAVAHGRITFTSDSPRMEEVGILIEDKKDRKDSEPYWCAEIQAPHLRTFCERLLAYIEDTIG